MKSSADLRRTFLDFFHDKGHEVVASSPLLPGNDSTLLFTNAGMVQFKDTFLGREQRPYRRAVSVQRCVRAGGKHNDLENVGYTARHHTFFEMLGNFSFGDYFKRDAIHYSWEFLTQVLGLSPEKLWVTVYVDDDEAADIWLKEIGIDPGCFSRIGDKPGGRRYESDNFWSMGDSGPCGPCSEIFYDHGTDIQGAPPGTSEEEGDRYIEIWNLVFMQYNRDTSGALTELHKPSVDTGMGLERLAAVMQGVHSNFEIDIFQRLIDFTIALVGEAECDNASLKVVADHIRSCAFLIVDGVVPSNEGRGYVLRRIIRRAIRHGHKLNLHEPFFHKLIAPLEEVMGDAYPELTRARDRVERVLRQEEERFAETLEQGMQLLEETIANLRGNVIDGTILFKLYDTYGFPVDLTADVARERNLTVDIAGFEAQMKVQRERTRTASHFASDDGVGLELEEATTDFIGYAHLTGEAAILALYREGKKAHRLEAGERGMVVLDRTPFYGESGGQVGDIGTLETAGLHVTVNDTQRHGTLFVHLVQVHEGGLCVGDRVKARVDDVLRRDIAYHHSATHLLHAALRRLLGEHVQQKGSLVSAERLRFDFSHFEMLSTEQLAEIEGMVNDQIRANHEVSTSIMPIDEAKAKGAVALFGEKYGDEVRVLRMGEFSIELCGGTHVGRTGDIGFLKIISESGIAAGVRRLEAVAGQRALEWIRGEEQKFDMVTGLVHGHRGDAAAKVRQLIERNRNLERELEQIKAKLATTQGADLAAQAVEISGIKVLAARLEGADPKSLRGMVDQLKERLGSAAVLLAAVKDGKISLVAGVTTDCMDRIQAGEMLKVVAGQIGGKGGGRPDMAQGGGTNVQALNGALDGVVAWVRKQLQV